MNIPGLSPDQVTEMHAIAAALRAELEPKVLGTTKPGWSCSCGCLGSGPAEALAIQPGSAHGYTRQGCCYLSWAVEMGQPGHGYTYTLRLTEFIADDELNAIFDRRFRAFCAKHFPADLAREELRRSEGDLKGTTIGLWL